MYIPSGTGNSHVLLIGATHGSEPVTTTFLIYFLDYLLNNLNTDNIKNLLTKYTFHFLPILNPEGYSITSNIVLNNTQHLSQKAFESLAKKYMKCYNLDDDNAKANLKSPKNHRKIFNTNYTNIFENTALKHSIFNILNSCKLHPNVLIAYASNGNGIDLNSNSIHKFSEITCLRKKQKFSHLRYNDIPVNIPSPIGYPGKSPLYRAAIENIYLNNYIKKLYKLNYNSTCSDNLVAIFSFHSTGGEIFGFVDPKLATIRQKKLHELGMKVYSSYTNYSLIDEKYKFGIMDYYRISLHDVLTLTIELSSNNGNPIGPYTSIYKLKNEFDSNIEALINTIDFVVKNRFNNKIKNIL